MVWVLTALAVVLLLDVAVRVTYVRVIVRQFEAQPPFNVTTHAADPMAEQISTTTSDGVVLRGSLHRGVAHQPRGLVVFCPEVAGSHWSAGWYCEGLLNAGFDVVSFDFRGQGDSDSQPGYVPNHWPTQYEVRDINAVLQFVAQRDDLNSLPLVMMGVSRGSLIALHTAARVPQVRAVCADSSYTVDSLLEHFTIRWSQLYLPASVLKWIPLWHLRLTLRLARWYSALRRGVHYLIVEPWLPHLASRPVLLISGERDNYAPPAIIRELSRRIDSPLCHIWSVPKAKHNQARDAAREDYDHTVEQFFADVCPVPHMVPQPQTVPELTPAAPVAVH